ncbi:hypothetical protein J2Z23_001487 [Lederbergia galactosidilyticus]|uniref:hypothetical protein n=1 Tax=Lederbergia galactosidilytica TaxID=217031 RepID=UPI001AE29183|nr:hypothetical protein [Lederbergia galactosidilytica]MBP1914542.1 hypothetical protein [Lederbergia galactosidilytica]
MSGYTLKLDNSGQVQKEDDLSFIGGQPRIPENLDIPSCSLCGSEQTFFFQIAFPEGHSWQEFSMAVFQCTNCANEEELIPEMLDVPLKGADIPKEFLKNYQRHFRILVFRTSAAIKPRQDYQEKIMFKRWVFETTTKKDEMNKVGGQPLWLIEDEAPATYNGEISMTFLMQLGEGFEFELTENAPPQMRIGLRGDPEPSPNRYYELFLANQLYFFGTTEMTDPMVYVVTQI